MDEHSYIRSVHRQLPPEFYRWKINDNFAGGVPDTFYCGSANVLFAEYKYLGEKKLPRRESTVVTPDCSPLQLKWLRDRYEENVAVLVILGTPLGSVVFSHLSWETGIPKGDLTQFVLSAKQVAALIVSHCTMDNQHVNENKTCYHARG